MRITTEALQTLYAETLEHEAKHGQGNKKTLRRMLKLTLESEGMQRSPDANTWVWSDLHLQHRNIIKYSERPFENVDQMDDALHRAWRNAVGENDTVICGGDVALSGALRGIHHDRVRNAPGRKLLIIGNHDLDRKGKLQNVGFETSTTTLVLETEPQLLLTHLPLHRIPAGTVNVFGHVHNNVPLNGRPAINICVEHTEYKPVKLETVLELARALAAGHIPPGTTTAERIAHLQSNSQDRTEQGPERPN